MLLTKISKIVILFICNKMYSYQLMIQDRKDTILVTSRRKEDVSTGKYLYLWVEVQNKYQLL